MRGFVDSVRADPEKLVEIHYAKFVIEHNALLARYSADFGKMRQQDTMRPEASQTVAGRCRDFGHGKGGRKVRTP